MLQCANFFFLLLIEFRTPTSNLTIDAREKMWALFTILSLIETLHLITYVYLVTFCKEVVKICLKHIPEIK